MEGDTSTLGLTIVHNCFPLLFIREEIVQRESESKQGGRKREQFNYEHCFTLSSSCLSFRVVVFAVYQASRLNIIFFIRKTVDVYPTWNEFAMDHTITLCLKDVFFQLISVQQLSCSAELTLT